MLKYIHLQVLHGFSTNVYPKQVFCCFSFALLWAQPYWFDCSLPVKSRKGLAHDIIDASATHAGPLHDVTDTDCFARHRMALETFKAACLQLPNLTF